MPEIQERLTKKLGPLPVYAWGIIGGGAVFLWRHFHPKATPADTPVQDASLVDPSSIPANGTDYGTGAAGGYGSGLVDISSLWTDANSPFNPDNPNGINAQIAEQNQGVHDLVDAVAIMSPADAGQPAPQLSPQQAPAPLPAVNQAPVSHAYLPTLGGWAVKPKTVPDGYRLVQSGPNSPYKGKWIAVDATFKGA
jgi:hypothetical protein